MSNSNHIVISDPSEGSICVAAGVGRNQCHYPCIARSLLGCDRLLLPPRYMSQGVISKGLLKVPSPANLTDSRSKARLESVVNIIILSSPGPESKILNGWYRYSGMHRSVSVLSFAVARSG